MKKFLSLLWLPFRWLWKLLSVGMALGACFLFLASLLLVGSALLNRQPPEIPDGATLVIAPQGDIVEQRSPAAPLTHLMNNLAGVPVETSILLQDLLDCIYAAADDPKIDTILLDPDQINAAGLNQVRAIGNALAYFKAAGKQVIAAADSYTQLQYYLASWADKIYLHPMGRVQVKGFSVFRLYAHELFKKLSVDFHVFRVGTFKSALEPLTRNDMSAPAKAANKTWLDALWEVYSTDIAEHRGMTAAEFKNVVNNFPSLLAAAKGNASQMALNNGLIDGVKDRQELHKLLNEQSQETGEQKETSLVSYATYLRILPRSYTSVPGDADGLVGIITATGNILYGNGAVNQIGSTPLSRQIQRARKDQRIKALVLRLSTGGGSAFASELIRQELLAVQQAGKPVVISMGSMAASGGYWLAADADLIVASPFTLTGSIGIFGAVPTFEQTLKKIGVHGDGVGTGKTALFGNPATTMSEDEIQYHQLSVEHGYNQFLSIVSEGRDMSLDKVNMVAEGRVWDGKTAMRLGLIDRLGTLEDAIAAAADLAGIPAENALYVTPAGSGWMGLFSQYGNGSLQRTLVSILPGPLNQAFIASADFLSIKSSADPHDLYAHSLLDEALFTF